jgi:hypothetical protein
LGDAVTLTEPAAGGREQAPLDGGAKHTAVTDDHDDAQTDELMAFVTDRVAPLAKTFAQLPVMQLRVRTAQGMITLVKAAAVAGDGAKAPSAAKSAHAPRIQEGEPGRAYDTINAEAVGVFRTSRTRIGCRSRICRPDHRCHRRIRVCVPPAWDLK